MEKCWCGNKDLKEYSTNYYVCEKCKTLVSKFPFEESISSVKDEEHDLYGANYWKKVMTEEAGVDSVDEIIDLYLRERALYWLKYLLKKIPLKCDVAEIGCGLGQLAYLMKALEYRQSAFDLSPALCKYVAEQLKINILCEPFGSDDKKYDVILAFDVFEHLLEPEVFLQNCTSHLTEEGILCFQTPCYDDTMDYGKMCELKPRFKKLMVEKQHIFLYSRQAVTSVFEKYGFTNITFEPAIFGNDYDMFFFASRVPIQENTDKEIDDYLNSVENGRLVKAMLSLYESNRALENQYKMADSDRILRQQQNCELEESLKQSESDRLARLEQVNKLTLLLKESESDRAERTEQINKLTGLLKESDNDRATRLEQINELTRQLKESEADRMARLDHINELSRLLQESEADRAARLEQINELTRLLQMGKQDGESGLN